MMTLTGFFNAKMYIVFVIKMVVLTALFFGIQFVKNRNSGMSSVKVFEFRP
jgi:hypothetical protein